MSCTKRSDEGGKIWIERDDARHVGINVWNELYGRKARSARVEVVRTRMV